MVHARPWDDRMEARGRPIGDRLRSAGRVGVYCHIDADGVSGGAIASEALSRAGIEHDVSFLKKLDEASIRVIEREAPPAAWFVGFGAGPPPLLGPPGGGRTGGA